MKSLVVYSSLTGNTEKVARAIFDVLPDEKEIFPVEKAPPADDFDFVAVGYWVDKGEPDKKARKYMGTLKNRTVGLFGTLGAPPDSEHSRKCKERAADLVVGNLLAGSFLCQGKIDPKVVKMMQKHAQQAHPMTPERIANIKAAESHPDEADLAEAQRVFQEMIRDMEGKGAS